MIDSQEYFINRYPISKTLRFRLLPQGRTLEHIKEKGFLDKDKERAQNYKKAKELIDAYHKWFIENTLGNSGICIDWNPLAAAIDEAQNSANSIQKSEARKALTDVQAKMRAEIVALFEAAKDERFKTKKNKEGYILKEIKNTSWITDQLLDFFELDEEKQQILQNFKKFNTYFVGFTENRNNIYSKEEQSTAIAYRLVNENFPKFYSNVKTYRKLKEKYPKAISLAKANLQELLGDINLDSLFEVDYFNATLSQKGIDFYNQVLGGWFSGGEAQKYKGLNECANQAFQQDVKDNNPTRFRFTFLFKQILSDHETLSFVSESINSDEELAQEINEMQKNLESLQMGSNTYKQATTLVESLETCDLKKIYVKKDNLAELSTLCFGGWSVISNAIDECKENLSGPCAGMKKKEAEAWAKSSVFALQCIITALKQSGYLFESNTLFTKLNEIVASIALAKEDVRIVLDKYCSKQKRIIADESAIFALKNYLDFNMQFFHVFKLFEVDPEEERDEVFYALYDELLELFEIIVPVYNKVRNYVTQKPYSVEKFKLNFEQSTLLDGWDLNKEQANLSVLFLKDGKYYLGIMNKEDRRCLEKLLPSKDGSNYQKMQYKLLPGPEKMLPKVFFSKSNIDFFNPSDEILRIKNSGTYRKDDNFSLNDCHALIDFYKRSLERHEDWSQFNFTFRDTAEYNGVNEFFEDVRKQGYSITFRNIAAEEIDKLVDEGKLYLFQIYCKDFSEHSTGAKNLHTYYFENLFSVENLENVVLALNGGAELFYRPASIENPYAHKKDSMLLRKTLTNSNERIPDSIYEQLSKLYNNKMAEKELSDDAQSYLNMHRGEITAKKATHEIIKDKRFTEDNFMFHVPIKINFSSSGSKNFNSDVLDYVHANPDVKIIGIDRGERHLLYVSLIDQNGNILQQQSLNVINGIDYRDRLDIREKERTAARKNWKSINAIKDLKSGYLSTVVDIIARMMVENNAVLVMEDLNSGFKRSRVKFEKQVYQNFEKALIDKLNYYAQKPTKIGITEPGGILRGYQLTDKFESFTKMRRQTGFIFYVPAWNTSHIDPTTGFVNLFPKYKNEDTAKGIFMKMNAISYDVAMDCFKFSFDYSKLNNNQAAPSKLWTVCSVGKERLISVKNDNRFECANVDVTNEIKKILEKEGVVYEHNNNLIDCFSEIPCGHGFFKSLYYQFKNLVQLRYSVPNSTESADDYILSPVMNKEGIFFDSRKEQENLPNNADANGAYCIALKGLQLIREQIEQKSDGTFKLKELKKGQNTEWLRFIQGR